MSEKFCIKWKDFETNVSKSFGLLRNEDYLHDVTLVCDDNQQVQIDFQEQQASKSIDLFRWNFFQRTQGHPRLHVQWGD